MNRHERDRLLASLTNDEVSVLRARAGIADAAPPEDDDAERQFVRSLLAEPNNWLADTLDRLSAARPPGSVSVDNRDFIRQLLGHARGGDVTKLPKSPPSTDQPS